MRRLQFQLPDELYQRAKALAEEHNIAFSEITTRGMEMYLESFPPAKTKSREWVLPSVSLGQPLVPLEKLRDISRDEELRVSRSLTHSQPESASA